MVTWVWRWLLRKAGLDQTHYYVEGIGHAWLPSAPERGDEP